MMIRIASAAAIAALMSTAAMAQSTNAPMTQPAPKIPMAQTASRQMAPSTRFMTALPANGASMNNYYKKSVYDPSGNKVGDVSDLIVDKNGRIVAAMIGSGGSLGVGIGAGGYLGMDQKNVAIPFDALKASQGHLTVNTTKAELKRAPGFKYDSATTTWMSDKSARSSDRKAPRLADTKPLRK